MTHQYYLPKLRKVVGSDDPEIISKLYAAFMKILPVSEDDFALQSGSSIIDGGEPQAYVYKWVTRDGGEKLHCTKVYETAGSPDPSERGNPYGW